MGKPEMVKIKCLTVPDHPWTSQERMNRERAQATIALIEAENAADPKRGCAGPHEVVPA